MHVRLRAPLVAMILIVLAACGGSGSKKKAAPPPPPPTTTSTAPQPTVTVTPQTAQSGTKLTLTVSNFTAGDAVTFEIDMPGGRTFKGQPHTIAADGTVSATFLVTAQNPVGDYVVKAAAAKGQVAQTTFTVTGTAGATTTTAVRPLTTTTARPAGATTTTTHRP